MPKRNLFWEDSATIQKLKTSLKENNVSITTTDTVLGFIAPLTKEGYDLLTEIKGSRPDKPYLLLISSPSKLDYFIDSGMLDKNIKTLIQQYWPGPLTIIFKAKKELVSHVVSKEGTIAIRCPAHDELLQVLEEFDGLFSTSANKSGQPIFEKIEDISPDILKKIDYIVVDRNYADKKSQPSTIIDVSGSNIKVIREGA